MYDTIIVFEIEGLRNPRTFEETGTFSITTFDSDLTSEIDSGFDKSTRMTVMGDLSSFGAQPSNVTNGAENTYTFTLATQIPIHNGDTLYFTMPKQITTPPNAEALDCLPVAGLTDIKCAISPDFISVEFAEVEFADGTFQWTFDNLQNPPTLQRSDKFSEIYVEDADGYEVAQLDGELTTGILNQKPAAILPPYSLVQSNVTASALAEYAISFYPTNAIPTEGSIQVSWPAQVSVDEDAVCSVETNRVFTDNCDIEPGTNTSGEGESGGTITMTGVFADQE